MKKMSMMLAWLTASQLVQSCTSTEQLYARYDERACRVSLEQTPSGHVVVRELTRDESMLWEPLVRFELEQDVLGSAEMQKLDRDVSVLLRFPELRLSVRGFTDASGSRAFNTNLAKRRVKVVIDYLRSRGVAEHRMDAVPLGEGLPLSLSKSAREPLNRRVELLLLDANGQPLRLQLGVPRGN